MGPEAREAVPTLLQLLHEESAQNRKLAAWTLGYIGQGAVEAIPALLVALHGPRLILGLFHRAKLLSVAASIRHQCDEFAHPGGTEAVADLLDEPHVLEAHTTVCRRFRGSLGCCSHDLRFP